MATPLDWPLTIVVGQYPPPEMDGWLFGKTRGVDDGLLGHHHYLHHDPLWSLPILARLFETIFRSEIVLRDWLESRELFCCTQLILYEWNFQVKRCDIRDGMIDFLPWNFAGGSSTIRMKKSTAVLKARAHPWLLVRYLMRTELETCKAGYPWLLLRPLSFLTFRTEL